MLHVQQLSRSVSTRVLLDHVSFVLNDGEHVGLIGPNGCGKSTLLRCVVGLETPDGGQVVRVPTDLRIGYLPQVLGAEAGGTLGEALAKAGGDLNAALADVEQAADQLAAASPQAYDSAPPTLEAAPQALEAALEAYDAALQRFEVLGGAARQARTARVLEGLTLAHLDPAMPLAALSGGQKTRLGLATLLLGEPELLLLDEPTNHLDLEALEWLEGFVQTYPGAVLVVSHDRAFLDATVSRILHLDPETHTLRSYAGGYSAFAAARAHEQQLQLATWRDQEQTIARMQADISRLKSEARSIEQSTTARQPGLRKFARKKAALGKSRERKLERYVQAPERVEKPSLHWAMHLDFGTPPPSGRLALQLEHLRFGYPGQPLLFDDLNLELRYGQRLALVGPNGSGKTTLLRLITGEVAPLGGTLRLGAGIRLGLMAQEHETLEPAATVFERVRGERTWSEPEARQFLSLFLFSGDAVFKRVAACSAGERSRLQLARLVIQGCNLLLLDEPLNHLDIESRQQFEQALGAFDGSVVVVAHDRVFLQAFRRRLELDGGPARRAVGGP